MTPRNAALAVALIALAGCGGAGALPVPEGFTVAPQPLPPEVLNAIPGEVSASEVVVRDGCFYYLRRTGVMPVVTFRQLANGITDQPFCLL